MAEYRSRTALGNVEDRLRRALRLAGSIGTELPVPLPLSPVIIADDATAVGYNILRGRRFMFGLSAPTAASVGSVTFRATADIRIDRLMIWQTNGANTETFLRVSDGSVADPYALAVTFPWLELPQSVTDLAPVLGGVSGAIGAVGTIIARWPQGSPAGAARPVEFRNLMLSEGWKYSVGCTAATSGLLNVVAECRTI